MPSPRVPPRSCYGAKPIIINIITLHPDFLPRKLKIISLLRIEFNIPAEARGAYLFRSGRG